MMIKLMQFIIFLLIFSVSSFQNALVLTPKNPTPKTRLKVRQSITEDINKDSSTTLSRSEVIQIGRDEFERKFSFPLDDWQLQAGGEIVLGHNVIVCAPTGSGKTVIGEMALHMAKKRQQKAIYTTPLKALSNQKFSELRNIFGKPAVGLSTGDMSINRDADLRVMTTEVYRNMAWRCMSTLSSSSPSFEIIDREENELSNNVAVVLDEFHYMGQPGRGGVWEESVITTPSHTQIVSLSATLPNALRLSQWIQSVTGRKTVLVESPKSRPVPLRYLFATRRGLHPLFRDPNAGPGSPKGLLGLRGDGIPEPPGKRKSKHSKNKSDKNTRPGADNSIPHGLQINPTLKSLAHKRKIRIDNAIVRLKDGRNNRKGDGYQRYDSYQRWKNTGRNTRDRLTAREERKEREKLLRREMRKEVPSLAMLTQRLNQKELLPAILFIFSRAGCDNAARDVCQQFMGPVRNPFNDDGTEEEEEPKMNKKIKRSRSRSKKAAQRMMEDKEGRKFRRGGNNIDDDTLTSIMEGTFSDMKEYMENFASESPLSSENWNFFASAGLLEYDQVKEVASRVASFNADNNEIAFEDEIVEQFLLGVGSHHAGQLPAHKAFVESLYRAQLMKIVFATETLAAGINMPARTTCICAMAKRGDGSTINLLETSNLLQMAGRAGRRGMDTDGTCVIVSTPFEDEEIAAGILLSEIKPITSQFAPSYPLLVNLISRGSGKLDVARRLTEKSFAMWERRQAEERINAAKETIGEPASEFLAANAHQRFLETLSEVLKHENLDNSANTISLKRRKVLADILDNRKMLIVASKSYVGISQRLEGEMMTIKFLEDELADAVLPLSSEEKDLFQYQIAEDQIDIQQQIETQRDRITAVEEELDAHPFTSIAEFVNNILEGEGLTNEVMRTELAEIQKGSDKLYLAGKDLSEYAKSAVTLKKNKKEMKKKNAPDPNKLIEEANRQFSSSSMRDGTWNDMLALNKVLACYGCIESDWVLGDTDDDLENKSFNITTAGQHVGMLSLENSLWGLVAMGGAHDVVGASSNLDMFRSSLQNFDDDLGILESESESELLDELFGPMYSGEEEEGESYQKPKEKNLPNSSLLAQKESALLTKHLEELTAYELAGYVSCLVSDRRSGSSSVAELFKDLTAGQKQAVQSALAVCERLIDVQNECGTSDSNTRCDLDLATAGVVTAWASGCTWSEALEISGSAPGDLVRMLGRVMDALRQFGNLPFNPVRRESFNEDTGELRSSLGISTKLRNLCRDAARAMNRYPVKDPLPFDTDNSEVEDEFGADEESEVGLDSEEKEE